MEPARDLIREYDTKAKMAILCNQSLKLIARKKKKKLVNNKKMTSLLDAFINEKTLTLRYSVLLTIIFGREFEEIKNRVTSGTYNLEHISTEKYWGRGSSKIKKADAIFFAYTFYCEAFPKGDQIISNLSQMLLNNNDLDTLGAIDDLINEC